MRILTMLWKNLWGGSRTLLFPARPTVAQRFRGLVQFDPELCSGCAICKFRCTSRAITYQPGKGEFTWAYDPGQCTFCGRCVEGCTEHALKEGHTQHALSQESACPPIYLQQGELKRTYIVKRKAPAPKAAPPTPQKAAAPVTEPATGGTQ